MSPSATISSCSSIAAVNVTSTIFEKYSFIRSVTIIPSSVATSCFFSLKTYPRAMIVVIVGEYVDGLPIPFSSSALIRLASV